MIPQITGTWVTSSCIVALVLAITSLMLISEANKDNFNILKGLDTVLTCIGTPSPLWPGPTTDELFRVIGPVLGAGSISDLCHKIWITFQGAGQQISSGLSGLFVQKTNSKSNSFVSAM